ncbi:MAG: hypothetical protein ACKOSS_00190 [Planctomycetia bacterium]
MSPRGNVGHRRAPGPALAPRGARVLLPGPSRARLPGLLLALLLLAPGCGTGGGTGSRGELLDAVLSSVPAEDGVVFSDGGVQASRVLPVVGDLDGSVRGLGARQFLSFDVTGLPGEVLVESALLRLDLYAVNGTPLATHGSLVVDYLDYGTLDADDYAARALDLAVGTVATAPTLGPRTVDVTDALAQVLALGRPRLQFRLRFATRDSDGDSTSDNASVPEAEAATSGVGQAPTLLVTLRRR